MEESNNMIEKLAGYNLMNDGSFINYLKQFNGYIAGSAALFPFISHLYPSCEEQEGDLDIWVQISTDKEDKSFPYSKDVRDTLCNYFSDNGYVNNPMIDRYSASPNAIQYFENTRFNNLIEKIYEFKSTHLNKKIQLILTKVSKEEILKSFDLSFCAVSWDGDNFFALEPELTKQKKGYYLNDPIGEREEKRKDKYLVKGFEITEYVDLW